MKIKSIILILLILLFSSTAFGAKYYRTALTGGSSNALDGIDGDDLNDGDLCDVVTSTTAFYSYRLSASSGAAEDSPDVIAPDTNPGSKRWLQLTNVIHCDTFDLNGASNFTFGDSNDSTWTVDTGTGTDPQVLFRDGNIIVPTDITFTGAVSMGPLEFTADAGEQILIDSNIVSAADGVPQSVSINVGNSTVIKAYSESTGAGAVDTLQLHCYGDGGSIVKNDYRQDIDLADDGTFNLPAGVGGHVWVSCNAESGWWNVQTDGTCSLIVGTTNTAATDSDTDLCVYDGGTYAIVKNRLGATGRIIVHYEFN